MGLIIENEIGQTPLDEEEKDGLLIKSVSTRGELDEFEQMNIEQAVEWTMTRRFGKEEIICEGFVKELHRRMFGDVWKWAGDFRRSNKNMGCDWKQVTARLKQLNDDFSYWVVNKTFPGAEAAIRYKHRVVGIHCFANGNGRHSRLMADVIISNVFDEKVFSWGAANPAGKGEVRNIYLRALKQADKGNLKPLLDFAAT